MRAHGIRGAKRRGKPWRTTTPDQAARWRPDTVARDFTATGPDRPWRADITYVRCSEDLVFFAFVIDAHSRRVVGWQLASHMRTALSSRFLRIAALRVLRSRRRALPVALNHEANEVPTGEGSTSAGPSATQTLVSSPRAAVLLLSDKLSTAKPPIVSKDIGPSTFE
jgi:transposase InsO family protein